MVIADLLPILKVRLNDLSYRIVDEDLVPSSHSYVQFNSQHKLWLGFPPERVRKIDSNAVETLYFPADYTLSVINGTVSLNTPVTSTDVIRADYSFFPFTDEDLMDKLNAGKQQVQVLTFHTIPDNFNIDYSEAILKKSYVDLLRAMQFPTTKYFSVSVGGRTMDKSTQVTNMNAMIESIEKDLLLLVNSLRYYNKTNVLS